MESTSLKEMLEKKSFRELRELMENSNVQDISAHLDEFDGEELLRLYRLLSKDKAADVFSYMEPDTQESLITSMTDRELKEVMDEMYSDDAARMIDEMPANVVKRILSHTSPEDRAVINELLHYPSGSAGSVMTVEFVDLKEHMTVSDAFAKIRRVGVDKETIYICYVLDDARTLIGTVSVKAMLLSEGETMIRDIMETNFISINTLDDKEDAAKMFDKYDFLALPVVDTENKLVGIITIDDAVDVLQEETTEDFEKMAAVLPSDNTYFRTGVFSHAKNRIVWLVFLMLSASITGAILTRYQDAFSAVPLLVSFIPMLMSTGGNCGSQSASLIIRGIAIDEIKTSDFFKAFFKEFRVASLVSIALAIVNGVRIYLTYKDIQLTLVISLALICTVIMSKLLGCSLPLLAKKLKLDPALMAQPLITTIMDTCSMIIYFNIAVMLMGNRIG